MSYYQKYLKYKNKYLKLKAQSGGIYSQMGFNQSNSNQQHYNQQHSNQQHSNQQHSNQQHSNQQHSNQQHSNQQHSNQQHYNQQHSNQQHSNQQHSNQQHYNQQHSNQQHSNQQHSNQQHYNQQHSNQQHYNQQHYNQQHSNQQHYNQSNSTQSSFNRQPPLFKKTFSTSVNDKKVIDNQNKISEILKNLLSDILVRAAHATEILIDPQTSRSGIYFNIKIDNIKYAHFSIHFGETIGKTSRTHIVDDKTKISYNFILDNNDNYCIEIDSKDYKKKSLEFQFICDVILQFINDKNNRQLIFGEE